MGKVNKRLQDLDPKSSPHLEKKWFGGSVDLDLLSQILKYEQEWLEESRGRASSSNSNNGGERMGRTSLAQGGRSLFIAKGEIELLGKKTGNKQRKTG